MGKCKIMLVLMMLCTLFAAPTGAFAGPGVYLPDEEGYELDWTFTEVPPKRSQPKVLNPAQYEAKWKIDNKLMFGIVQDQQGILYTADSGKAVHAVYPNGKEKWSIHLDMGMELAVIYLIVGQDGTLYAYSTDSLNPDGLTAIYALAPDGNIKWKLQSNQITSGLDHQFAGDAQGNFVLFTDDGLTSLNSKGEVNWTNRSITSKDPWDLADRTPSSGIYMDSQGNLYIDASQGEIISVDPSGKERWRSKPLPFINAYTGFHRYFSAKGFLYILTEDGLHAVDTRNGSMAGEAAYLDFADIRSSGIPTDGKGGYYINIRGRFLKMDRNGTEIWEYLARETEKDGLGPIQTPLSDQGGNVYFTTPAGNIIALNSEGQEMFVFLRNAFWSKLGEITLGKNGNIYSSNDDIGLAAFGRKQIQVYVDNLSLPLPVAPINKEGTVLVPFRSLFEHFGLKVNWDSATQTVTGTKGGLTIRLTVGSKTAYVNGQMKELAVAPVIEDDNIFVPLRFVGEALGRHVSWDSASSSVNIDR